MSEEKQQKTGTCEAPERAEAHTPWNSLNSMKLDLPTQICVPKLITLRA